MRICLTSNCRGNLIRFLIPCLFLGKIAEIIKYGTLQLLFSFLWNNFNSFFFIRLLISNFRECKKEKYNCKFAADKIIMNVYT